MLGPGLVVLNLGGALELSLEFKNNPTKNVQFSGTPQTN